MIDLQKSKAIKWDDIKQLMADAETALAKGDGFSYNAAATHIYNSLVNTVRPDDNSWVFEDTDYNHSYCVSLVYVNRATRKEVKLLRSGIDHMLAQARVNNYLVNNSSSVADDDGMNIWESMKTSEEEDNTSDWIKNCTTKDTPEWLIKRLKEL